MKGLKVRVMCEAYYDSTIAVPDDMDLEQAIAYAQENIQDIPITDIEWISDSDVIDKDEAYFEEEVNI